MANLTSDLASLIVFFKTNLQAMEDDLVVVKMAVRISPTWAEPLHKAKVLEPKPFVGARVAKELENFLWDVEQYFKVVHTPDEEKVTLINMYLTSDAKLWWRTRDDDAFAGRPTILT